MARARSGHRRSLAAVILLVGLLSVVPIAAPQTLAADPQPDGTRLIVRYAPDALADTPRLDVAIPRPGESTAAAMRRLEARPGVERVSIDHRRHVHDEPVLDPRDETYFGELWGLSNSGQRLFGGEEGSQGRDNVDIDGLQALRATTGDPSLVVAVIDDGVDFTHPDLAERAWTNPGESGEGRETNGIDDDANGYVDDVNGWDFCHGDATVHDPGDDHHGTHVAGIIAGSLDGGGIVGIAPGIRIMALKFLGDDPTCGFDSQAIEAIAYAASFGVRIINASWGGRGPVDSAPELHDAIAASGALWVASAGNDGIDNDTNPLPDLPAAFDLDNILAVSAVDNWGAFPGFANTGRTTVDLVAPGVAILSSIPADTAGTGPPYEWFDGTSMAAAYVSGTAALTASRLPGLLAQPTALKARLLATVKSMPFTKGWTRTGGMISALRAVDIAGPVVGSPVRLAFGGETRLGRKTVDLRISWPTAVDDLTKIAAYGVGSQVGGGGWTTSSVGADATATHRTIRLETTVAARVRAQDGAGNWGAYRTSPTAFVDLREDGSSKITYSSGWSKAKDSGASGGRTRMTRRAGATARFTFTGRAFALVATRGPSSGKVKVYVDGAHDSTVNLHRSSKQTRMIVAKRSWTSSGTHTVRLVVSGTRKHPRVDLDAFVVLR